MAEASNCYMSILDLFSKPVINTTIIDSKPVTYFPNNPINEESPIEFNITAPEYTDLNDHYLRLILEVVDMVEETWVTVSALSFTTKVNKPTRCGSL